MFVTSCGTQIFYDVAGAGERDLLLLPPCYPIVHSRLWKAQVPYLSRHFRVITMDFRGNGQSDRALTGYDFDTHYADIRAVLTAAEARWPVAIATFSCSAMVAIRLAVEQPEAVSHLILLSAQYSQPLPQPFDERFAPLVRDDFEGYLQRLFTSIYPEPHSLRAIEEGIAFGRETTPAVLVEAMREIGKDNVFDLLPEVRARTLVIHGTRDRIVPYKVGKQVADTIPGAAIVTFENGGHGLAGREAAKVNLLIRDFIDGQTVTSVSIPPAPQRQVPPPRPRSSQRRILWLSSPIGLGHIQRDLAIARELRALHPDASIDFLAADPARRVVEQAGERLHPATDLLRNESAHVESYCTDHELHAFNALWEMDEIMAANFMVFSDVVERSNYDLWVGDEGWDLDYYLHENPDMKAAPYVFLTDFIGMLPMTDDPASPEFRRVFEKNAENLDHLRHHPDVRDLSILVGDEEDVLDREFGPGLPNMRQWAREHFRFSGYTYHFDPADYRDKAALRARLGYPEGERVILVSVGGTRAGRQLLHKCAGAFALIADAVPDTRMVIVAGPRLREDELPRAAIVSGRGAGPGPGSRARLEIRRFIPDLFEHHAACDLAIVQGGLSTTMELAAVGTPFLYFPLRNHFEQQHFVSRRLERLGAGTRMDYDRTTPEALAAAMLEHLRAGPSPRVRSAVPTDGTARAARMMANLL
ncbi:MAG TPA: alpha/beta fold hydrolase [Polyangia bacterium]|nr:alpha/beta fold hydrolase [Polyangia bacterium]